MDTKTSEDHQTSTEDNRHHEHSKMLSVLQNILEYFHERQVEYSDAPQAVDHLDSFLDSELSEFYDRFLEDKEDDTKPEKNEEHHEKQTNSNGVYTKLFEKHEKEEPMQKDMSQFQVEDRRFVPLANLGKLNLSAVLTDFAVVQNTTPSRVPNGVHNKRLGILESTSSKRDKNFWISAIKNSILQGTGRNNDTSLKLSAEDRVKYNFTRILHNFSPMGNSENMTQEQNGDSNEYVEKLRSFYPSCEVPRNTDEEMWEDTNSMNLFFGVDYGSNDDGASSINVASATLRLYRLPQNKTSTSTGEDCHRGKDSLTDEDDRQIRVSVYWYTRSLKKHKTTKRRLTDSRMVSLSTSQNYIEMNIRPAARSWTRDGRNLGLAVVVEDVDGLTLTASHYFRDVGCHTVGNVSTPKPIPSLVIDSLRNSKFGISLNNSDRITYGYHNSMPILDICTLEPIPNITLPPEEGTETSSAPCRNSNNGRTKSPATLVKSIDVSVPKHNIRHHHRHHHNREAKVAAIKQFFSQYQTHTSRDDR